MLFEIDGQKWLFIFVDSADRRLMRSDGSFSLACTDGNTHTVYLSCSIPSYKLDKVISHELCHVYSLSNGLSIPIVVEEYIADFLATYGRDIFRVADTILYRFFNA